MKTLQLSDEDYEFLKDCVHELKTQDNRCTKNPLYTIHRTEKQYGLSDGFAEDEEYIWEDSSFESLEEIFHYMIENQYEDALLEFYNKDEEEEDQIDEITSETLEKIKEWFLDNYDTDDFLADKYHIYKVGVRKVVEQVKDGGCFSFFEKDAFDHIKLNGHNITGEKVHTYADSLYRTPRMEKLLELLNNLKFEETKTEKSKFDICQEKGNHCAFWPGGCNGAIEC